MPKVIYAHYDVTLELEPDEPSATEWPDVSQATFLGDIDKQTELWLVQGRLIKVIRQKTVLKQP